MEENVPLRKKRKFSSKKIIIFILIFVFLGTLIYFLIIPQINILNFTKDSYKILQNNLLNIKEQLRQQLTDDLYSRIYNSSDFEKIYVPYRLKNIELFMDYSNFNKSIKDKESIFFYDCHIETLSCKNKTIYSDHELKGLLKENYYKEKDYNAFIVYEKNESIYFYFINNFSDEELISSATFFEKKKLRNLRVSQEIDSQYKELLQKIFKYDPPEKPTTIVVSLKEFYSGKTLSFVKNNTLFFTWLGLEIGKIREKKSIAIKEWSLIQDNKLNKTPFSNSSYNINDYEKFISNSIKKIDQEYSEINRSKKRINVSYPTYDFTWSLSITSRVEDAIGDIRNNLTILRFNHIPKEITELRDSLNKKESRESRIIRLRILQYFISKEIIKNKCTLLESEEDKKDCRYQIINQTKQYHLCWDDLNCYIHFVNKENQTRICNFYYDKEECLNKIK